MELKVLLYIVGGIGYFLYSIYKNKQEETAKKATTKTSNPSALDTIELELKKLEEQLKQTNKPKPKPKAPPKINPARTYQSKEILIHDDINQKSKFEEGITNADEHYSRELTFEEQLHEERIRNSKNNDAILNNIEDESGVEFDVRKAFISSLIFDRPYR